MVLRDKKNFIKILNSVTRSKQSILIMLVLLFSCFTVFTPFTSNQNNDTENENNADTISSVRSSLEFNATKTITRGTQVNPPFNDDNIKYDDIDYDSTNFAADTDYDSFDYANTMVATNGAWNYEGSSIADTLADDDGDDLYSEHVPLTAFQAYQTWGYYSNFPSECHPHLYQIQINFDAWVDSFWQSYGQEIPFLSDFGIILWTNQGHTIGALLDDDPNDEVHRYGPWYINSGTFFNYVKNSGEYIDRITLVVDTVSAILDRFWINVDYVDIIYRYYNYDVDFFYELEFAGYGLPNISVFNITIEAIETITDLDVYLYDFNHSYWYLIGTINSPGVWKYSLTIDAFHVYFNTEMKMQIRFEDYNFFPVANLITIDHITVDFKPPDAPSNLVVQRGTLSVLHVFLDWDEPVDYGAPITHYNVYRGQIMGGSKALVGTSTVDEFYDTAVVVGVLYYYVISADSVAGESLNSTEVPGVASEAKLPFISSPEDITYEEGTALEECNCSWVVTEEFPHMYNVTRNNTLVANGSYHSLDPIVVFVGGLSVGVYSFVLSVNDTWGNSAYDEVIVTVTEAEEGEEEEGFPWLLAGAGIGVVAVVIILALLFFKPKGESG